MVRKSAGRGRRGLYDSAGEGAGGYRLAYGQGDIDGMKESAAEGLKLSSEAGLGSHHRAPFVVVLGAASWQEDDYERATKLAEESLSLSRQANDMGVWRTLSSY
jgi:hypothetical protein